MATAAVAWLVGVIMGEYEPTVWTALATGVVVGAGLPEVVLGIAHWRGRVPAVVTAACAAAAIVYAGWISAGRGLAPIRGTVWPAAVLAAAVAFARLALLGRERHRQQDVGAGTRPDGEHADPAVG